MVPRAKSPKLSGNLRHTNRIFDTNQAIRPPQFVDLPAIVSVHTPASSVRKLSDYSHLLRMTSVSRVQNWFVQNLRNYCNSTSLHGFNYITLRGSSTNERHFWISVALISMITSIVLVLVSWFWNRETPTVTVIESAHFPTWNIAFPAVTVCNFNKISRTKAVALAKTFKRPDNITEERLLRLFRITMFLNFALNHTETDYILFEKVLVQNNYTLDQLAQHLAPNCMDMISKCMWKGTSTRCDSLFQRVSSMEGICCSFNYYGRPTNNFPEKIAYQLPKRPYRVTGCGYTTGISVVLNPMKQDYFGTYVSSYGFRLLIHNAYNYPDENAETKVVTSSRESFVRISPESTYATNEVKRMDVSLRNCLFYNERPLPSLQRYSFINCMTSCRSKLVHESCGCIPKGLPSNGSFPTCGIKEIDCVLNMRRVLSLALHTFNRTVLVGRDTKNFPCDCMADCEFNSYPSEITMGRLDMKLISNISRTERSISNDEQILLHVFFSDLMTNRYRRDIFQNWLSMLASFGGLLGLIMGFSIVTAFEFLYFLTFRPIFNYFNDP